MTSTSQYIIGTDTSSYKDRYNKFVITETSSSPVAVSGQITLTRKGLYTYTIREQASSTNLDPTLSGAIVETGKLKVTGSTETTYYHDYTNTKIVYNG